jgi:hypothetical protein
MLYIEIGTFPTFFTLFNVGFHEELDAHLCVSESRVNRVSYAVDK